MFSTTGSDVVNNRLYVKHQLALNITVQVNSSFELFFVEVSGKPRLVVQFVKYDSWEEEEEDLLPRS